MAKNEDVFADEFDEYDDWLEIYNDNDFTVDLCGLCLRNNANTSFYPIPLYNKELTTIPAKGFKLLWLDKDPEQGILHFDFKLAASGESIVLVQPLYSELLVIDSITYDEQEVNTATGRYPDGSANIWQLTLTPGMSNLITEIQEPIVDHSFAVYPNPASDYLIITANNYAKKLLNIKIFDIAGKQIKSLNLTSQNQFIRKVVDLSDGIP